MKIFTLLCLAGVARAQIKPKVLTETQARAGETVQARDARMQWWRDARFGLFIHWDPVALKGTEISISRSPNPYGPNEGGIPAAEYDQLYKRFNPTQFNAKAVVALAKAAGMKYIVLVTKHHDGFAMFDSQLTDYKITSPDSPYHRDITRQLADATHTAGLHWCVYYSQPDLHHPDYGQDWPKYDAYFHAQVHELMTKYGKVDGLWFDGLGGSAAQWQAQSLFVQMRADNPNVVINDRCGLSGDYYTPEQRIGAYDDSRDWETCMTIGDQWAYKPDDKYKSSAQCIQALARCSGGDGNFLLNIGLREDGSVDPTQQNRLQALAKWMKKNNQSIYGTRGGPFKPAASYASTRKGNTIYVHVFHWNGDRLQLPALPARVLSAKVLAGGKVKVEQGREGLSLEVPMNQHDEADTVIALQIDRSALVLATVDPTHLKAVTTASVVYDGDPTYDAAKAFDADPETRWATPNGTKTAWLQADLDSIATIKGIAVDEAYAGRVQRFQLQYRAPGSLEWLTLLEGTRLGAHFKANFNPVQVKSIRLNILDSTEGPTISELALDVAR